MYPLVRDTSIDKGLWIAIMSDSNAMQCITLKTEIPEWLKSRRLGMDSWKDHISHHRITMVYIWGEGCTVACLTRESHFA